MTIQTGAEEGKLLHEALEKEILKANCVKYNGEDLWNLKQRNDMPLLNMVSIGKPLIVGTKGDLDFPSDYKWDMPLEGKPFKAVSKTRRKQSKKKPSRAPISLVDMMKPVQVMENVWLEANKKWLEDIEKKLMWGDGQHPYKTLDLNKNVIIKRKI